MFPNLQAEQARFSLTNSQVAEEIDMNRNTYEQKKRSGRFTVFDCQRLCNLFNCTFEYLFATDQDKTA